MAGTPLRPARETNNSDYRVARLSLSAGVSASVYEKVTFRTCFLRVMSLFSVQLFSQTEKAVSPFFLPNTPALYHPERPPSFFTIITIRGGRPSSWDGEGEGRDQHRAAVSSEPGPSQEAAWPREAHLPPGWLQRVFSEPEWGALCSRLPDSKRSKPSPPRAQL